MDDLSYTTIIPAAGDSVRFATRGFSGPKGLLRFQWREKEATMLEHVAVCAPYKSLIVCKRSAYNLFSAALGSKFDIRAIEDSYGQAHTVYQAVFEQAIVPKDFLVINCDNAFDINMDEFVDACRMRNAACGAVVFRSDGETKYGYVDSAPIFKFGAEKIAISPFALAGAFYFKSRRVYMNAFDGSIRCPYVSQLFQYVSGPMYAHEIERERLHEWGTPEDIMIDGTVTGFDLSEYGT